MPVSLSFKHKESDGFPPLYPLLFIVRNIRCGCNCTDITRIVARNNCRYSSQERCFEHYNNHLRLR
jgi:hypothetical protein